MDNMRVNDDIFNSAQSPLYIASSVANSVTNYSFGPLSQETLVWAPSPQKYIQLTAVQASAPLGVTINLSNGGGKNFLSLRITSSSTALNLRFPSPGRFKAGDAIYVYTSNEESACTSSGATTATQVAFNGRSDFVNVSNATGLPNGQYATLNSALLVSTGGRIVLGYNLLPASISQLQIQSVVLKFYCRLSLTLAVGTSTMTVYWRPDSSSAWIQLQQVSLSLIGTADYLTTPLTQDITAQVLASANPWGVIGSLQTSFTGMHTGLGLGNSIVLDAVVIDLCCTGINNLSLFGFESAT